VQLRGAQPAARDRQQRGQQGVRARALRRPRRGHDAQHLRQQRLRKCACDAARLPRGGGAGLRGARRAKPGRGRRRGGRSRLRAPRRARGALGIAGTGLRRARGPVVSAGARPPTKQACAGPPYPIPHTLDASSSRPMSLGVAAAHTITGPIEAASPAAAPLARPTLTHTLTHPNKGRTSGGSASSAPAAANRQSSAAAPRSPPPPPPPPGPASEPGPGSRAATPPSASSSGAASPMRCARSATSPSASARSAAGGGRGFAAAAGTPAGSQLAAEMPAAAALSSAAPDAAAAPTRTCGSSCAVSGDWASASLCFGKRGSTGTAGSQSALSATGLCIRHSLFGILAHGASSRCPWAHMTPVRPSGPQSRWERGVCLRFSQRSTRRWPPRTAPLLCRGRPAPRRALPSRPAPTPGPSRTRLERQHERERRERRPERAALRGGQAQHRAALRRHQARCGCVPQQCAEEQVPLLLVARLRARARRVRASLW